MSISCMLTVSEIISLVAAISAAISAIFSALAAFLMYRQNCARIRIRICNDISTETPQNIYNNQHDFAFSCIKIDNISPRAITVSECYIEVNKKKFHALREDMKFEFDFPKLKLNQSKHVQRTIYKNDDIDSFTRIPIEITPFQSKELLLIFPDFVHTNANIIIATIGFKYGRLRSKRKKIILHKLDAIN